MLFQDLKQKLVALGGFLVIWTAAQSWLLLQQYSVEWSLAFLDSSITSLFLGLMAFLVFNTMNYYHPDARRLPVPLLGVGALAYGLMFGAEAVISSVRPDAEVVLAGFHFQRVVFSVLISITILVIAWFQTAGRTTAEDEERVRSTEKLARDAELASLRQQLQPHFLFNSLNSINALIGTQPEKARKMVQQLSDFLRGTIKKDDTQLVTLFEEMHQLKLYLEIEKVRFGHRLDAHIDNAGRSLEAKLPPLLIQPVVENAIKFGLYDTVGETIINIKTKVDNNHLVIEVENPFDAATAAPKQGTGFGLSSLQRRLYLLYARHDLLNTTQDGNLFITQIKIPQPS